MSYEFNPDSQAFEFPNPYKVENLSLMATGAFVLVAGLISMLSVRERIVQGADGRALAVAAISIALLLLGIALFARAFTQLRFYFGRNRPGNLAPQPAADQDGTSPLAAHYTETLRQNALTYPEPKGAINGLLYAWLPNLIFAPNVIQRTAQTLFFNCLSLTATFASFLLCWMMFGGGTASAWIGVAYALFAAPQVLRPMIRQGHAASGPVTAEAHVNTNSLVVLIVLAVLGPVALSLAAPHLPGLDNLSINGSLAFALFCALLGCFVFGAALRRQLQPAPQAIGSARVTETVTMNAHPNKLLEELDRVLLERWYANIPNRKYKRVSPVVNAQQGQFTAEVFEETQPRPKSNGTASSLGHALSVPQFRWLAVLTGLASVYLCIGTAAALLAGRDILSNAPFSTTAAFALSQIAVSLFCYRAAHVLWGRFDFTSEFIWVEINGSYESARVNIGNQISGNVQTNKSVINIESMTLRVWVSEIDTVIFGKDAPRQLVGMRGLPDTAHELAATLKGFGEARSMIVAPTANQDLERAQRVGVMNQLIDGSGGKLPAATNRAAMVGNRNAESGAAAIPAAASTLLGPICAGCGATSDADARFCGECGSALTR
jgi:hypothetical protein